MITRAQYFGLARLCPICGSMLKKFLKNGDRGQDDALCPICFSLPRHRAIYLFFENYLNDITSSISLLHVAPEQCLTAKFRQNLIKYTSVDLKMPEVGVNADLTQLPFASRSFDAIIASHVLEHVSDDLGAMREIRRVLNAHGWAILLVPIDWNLAATYEDVSIITPEARLIAFGQDDHVRFYGRDYLERLKICGFSVVDDDFVRTLDNSKITRYGLRSEEPFFVVYPR